MADLAEKRILLQRQLQSAFRSPRAAARAVRASSADLRLELAGIFHDLRGFRRPPPSDPATDTDAPADDLRDHRMRRRRADRPGQRRAPAVRESRASVRAGSRACPAPAPRSGTGPARRRAEDALRHDQQVLGLRDRRATSRARAARVIEDIDEVRALQPLQRAGKGEPATRDRRRRCSATGSRSTACTIGSSPVIPNSASGRSQPIPTGRRPAPSAGQKSPPGPKRQKQRIDQTAKPTPSPASAPMRVAPRQNSPPTSAGRICATPTKAISPIAASAAPPPDSLIIEIARAPGSRRCDSRRANSTSLRTSPDTDAPPLRRLQPERHHDMVRHHRRQGDRRHDDHRRRRRKAAEKGQHRQPFAGPRPSGRVSTNRSGLDPAGSRSSPTTAIGTTNRLISSR